MKKGQRLKTTTPVLELEGVTLRTPDGCAFERTSWCWQPGQHWAMLGPNGSGKSLLAWAVAGLAQVSSGEIRYGFPGPSRWTTRRRVVGETRPFRHERQVFR